jgi:hypothetical protein
MLLKHICQATAAIGARSWRFELQLDLLACVGVLVGPLRQRLGGRARRSFAAGKKRVSATMAVPRCGLHFGIIPARRAVGDELDGDHEKRPAADGTSPKGRGRCQHATLRTL